MYRFDGKTIDDYSPEEVAHIRNKKMGFVFQMFNLLPRTSVFENVKLPLMYSDAREKDWADKTLRAVESVRMTYRLQYETSQLSGGERQRVAIARALVNEPQVIFADEPTGNLDSESGRTIMETIQELHDKGHTVLLITHETYTAEHAERILHIRDGKIEDDLKVSNRRWAKDHSAK